MTWSDAARRASAEARRRKGKGRKGANLHDPGTQQLLGHRGAYPVKPKPTPGITPSRRSDYYDASGKPKPIRRLP
jgi:hypothetical protein